MSDIFLKAKHWQIFIFIFLLPLVATSIAMGADVSLLLSTETTSINAIDDLSVHMPYLAVAAVNIIGSMLMFVGWMWSTAIGLQKYIPTELQLKTQTFKIFFFISIIYPFLIMGAILFLLLKALSTQNIDDLSSWILLIPAIQLLSLFGMFTTLYIYYFVAKTIKTAERQKEVVFSDFIAECVFVWLLPLFGIWFLQPIINQCVEKHNNTSKRRYTLLKRR